MFFGRHTFIFFISENDKIAEFLIKNVTDLNLDLGNPIRWAFAKGKLAQFYMFEIEMRKSHFCFVSIFRALTQLRKTVVIAQKCCRKVIFFYLDIDKIFPYLSLEFQIKNN